MSGFDKFVQSIIRGPLSKKNAPKGAKQEDPAPKKVTQPEVGDKNLVQMLQEGSSS